MPICKLQPRRRRRVAQHRRLRQPASSRPRSSSALPGSPAPARRCSSPRSCIISSPARGSRSSTPRRKGGSRASISSRSPTTSCHASNMRSISPISSPTRRAGRRARAASASSGSPSNMPRRDSGSVSSAARACISTSSTIPANGCSTCRCFGSTIATGRGPRSSRAGRRQGRLRRRHGARRSPRSIPPRPPTRALAESLSDLFKAYLRETRADPYALSTLPPGRFLMPGDLAGSPALTFAPLDAKDGTEFPARLAVAR